MALMQQITNTLFGLLGWICAAGVLAVALLFMLFWAMKIVDKVRSVLWERRQPAVVSVTIVRHRSLSDRMRAREQREIDRLLEEAAE